MMSNHESSKEPDMIDALLRGSQPIYLPEEDAPTIDWSKLTALVRGELSGDTARLVHELCASFKSWDDAYTQVVAEELAVEESNSGQIRGSDHPQAALTSAAMLEETSRLCSFSYRDLLGEFAPYGDLVRGGDTDDPLILYREPLKHILCRDWNWVAKRGNPAFKEKADLALAIATVLAEREGDLPFPPEAIPVVAAILARTGLDDFCKLEDAP